MTWAEKAQKRADEINVSEEKIRNLKSRLSDLPKIPTLTQLKEFLTAVREIMEVIS